MVLQLLGHAAVDVNAEDDTPGRTALYWAVRNNHGNTVVELLKHEEVDVNVKGALGNTVLMWACLWHHTEFVLELLKHPHVDVLAMNVAGSTALDIAHKLELVEIVKCLEKSMKKLYGSDAWRGFNP